MSIALNAFVSRQIGVGPESKFGGWTGSPEDLLKAIRYLINESLLEGPVAVRRIYAEELRALRVADAVAEYHISNDAGFVCTHAVVQPGEPVEEVFEQRRPGEQPVAVRTVRRSTKPTAATVDLVFYNHDELVKTNDASSNADWELVSINGLSEHFAMGVAEPMQPATIWRNYLSKIPGCPAGIGGSYRDRWDDETVFRKELSEAEAYWGCRARITFDPAAPAS